MGFRVDPDSLRSRGSAIEDAAASAGGELRRSQSETVAGGAVWGQGLGLDAVYAELTRLTGEAVGLVGAAVARSGAGARRMAEDYQRGDGGVARSFDRIRGPG